jgi:hypothetical protein
MKPNDNSEIFLNALISQMQTHLQTVGGVYITTATVAPSPLPIPGMATWQGYGFEPVETEEGEEGDFGDGEESDGVDDAPAAEIGEIKRILGRVPVDAEWETPREMKVVDTKFVEPTEITVSEFRKIDNAGIFLKRGGGGPSGGGGGGGSRVDIEVNDGTPIPISTVGSAAPPPPPGVDLKKESNGKLDTAKLKNIDSTYGSGLLHYEAARMYDKMLKQAVKDGIAWTVSSTYRDYAGQVRCRAKYGAGSSASPGSSPHGWGLAMDFSEIAGTQSKKAKELKLGRATAAPAKYTREHSKIYRWLATNGPKYGWFNPYRLADGSRMEEAWHWEYWGFNTLTKEQRTS